MDYSGFLWFLNGTSVFKIWNIYLYEISIIINLDQLYTQISIIFQHHLNISQPSLTFQLPFDPGPSQDFGWIPYHFWRWLPLFEDLQGSHIHVTEAGHFFVYGIRIHKESFHKNFNLLALCPYMFSKSQAWSTRMVLTSEMPCIFGCKTWSTLLTQPDVMYVWWTCPFDDGGWFIGLGVI